MAGNLGWRAAVSGWLACAAFAAVAQPLPPRPPLETRVAWLSECPHDPDTKPGKSAGGKAGLGTALFAAVGPKLISGVIDLAATALKAAGDDRSTVTLARVDADFHKVMPEGDIAARLLCLVVMRGEFDDKVTDAAFAWAGNHDALTPLRRPTFYLEARIVPLRGAKFFQLVPVYLQVDDFEKFSIFDPKDRDFVVAVSLKQPGQASAFGSAEFLFKDVERGTVLKPGDSKLRLATSRPLAFPEPDTAATQAKAKLDGLLAPYLLAVDILTKPPEHKPLPGAPSLFALDGGTRPASWSASQQFCEALREHNRRTPEAFRINDERCAYTLDEPRRLMEEELAKAYRSPLRITWAKGRCGSDVAEKPSCPGRGLHVPLTTAQAALATKSFTFFTTDLTLTETREGSKLALFLGNALAASKDDVTKVLADEWLPKTQKQLDEADKTARDARAATLLADLEVTKAEQLLAEVLAQKDKSPSDETAARIALLKAKIAANNAHRAEGTPIPWPEVD